MQLIRLANPLVRAVLRSRFHRLLSRRLLLLAYRGRRSGHLHQIPLRYGELEDGRLVVAALRPERKLWWRSVCEAAPVYVVLRGAPCAGTATLADGAARDAALAAYVGGSHRIGRAASGAAVVVVTLSR